MSYHAPFTIREAEFALYYADVTGMRSGSLAMASGTVETLEIEMAYQEQRSDVHGRPYGRSRHIDEQHTITFGHIWSLQKATATMFFPRRDQQYILVVRWHDPERLTWHKRTYFAVTGAGERLGHSQESYVQEVPFSAKWCSRSDGLGEPPSMLPVLSGVVVYVTEYEALELFDYDPATHAFSPVDSALLAGRATIEEAAGVLQVAFGVTPALRIENDILLVNTFTAMGGSFLVGPVKFPRLEFRFGPMLHGTLSIAGELAAATLTETSISPTWENHFEFRVGGVWKASLGQGGVAAIELSEFLT